MTTISGTLIQQLQNALAASKSAFQCSGTTELPSGATLFAKVPENSSVVALDLPIREPTEATVKPLLDLCTPASFGRGREDVLDPSYRQAFRLASEQVALATPGFDISSILALISHTLVQRGVLQPVVGIFDKLNVYGPGGFFKSHADTPRGKGMFASLVICLPCAHSGGELVLRRHSGNASSQEDHVTLSWGGNSGLSWVAFFSDTEHEVLPVKSGFRITLTYNLFLDATNAPAVGKPYDALQHPVQTTLMQILGPDAAFPHNTYLGIHLQHQYIFGMEDSARSIKDCLRGSDFLVYQVLLELQRQNRVSFEFRFIVQFENTEEDEDGVMDQAVFPPETRVNVMSGWSTENESQSYIVENCGGVPFKDMEYPVNVINPWKQAAGMPHMAYGNQADMDFMYASVMLLIQRI